AAAAVQKKAQAAGRTAWLAPVMDGITMATHPFEPDAASAASRVALMIGHTRNEGTFFIATDPSFGRFTDADFEERARSMAGTKASALAAALKGLDRGASPTELIAELWTTTWAFAGSVTIAERKARQEAPVYAYMLGWNTPVAGGVLRATHALDVPL